MLTRAADFFRHAQNSTYRMDQIEREVRNADAIKNGGAVRESLTNTLRDLDDLVGEVDRRAAGCIALAETSASGDAASAGSAGVQGVASVIRAKADNLRTLAELKRSQASRGSHQLDSFVRRLQEVDEWINAAVVEFLRNNTSPGTSHDSARKFLELHRDLVNKIHMKTFELEGLRGALKTIADQCSNEETKNVEQRMDASNKRLTGLCEVISKRLGVSEHLVKFLKLFEQVDKELRQMEGDLSKPANSLEQGDHEESWLFIRQLFTQVCHLGKNCTEDIAGVERDEHLDKEGATAFIRECVARVSETQTKVIELRENVELRSKEGKKLDAEWDSIEREKREAVEASARIGGELFPVVNRAIVDEPELACRKLEERISVITNEVMIMKDSVLHSLTLTSFPFPAK